VEGRFGGDKNCGSCRGDGPQFMEITARYYKQQSTRSEVLEVHHCQVVPGLKVLKWGRGAETWEWTVWSEDPLGHKRNGWHQRVCIVSRHRSWDSG